MAITVDQIIQHGVNASTIIERIANLTHIYSFQDLTNAQKTKLINIYLLDKMCIYGGTTFEELDSIDSDTDAKNDAAYEIDCKIEDQWQDEYGLQSDLDEIDYDNKWRNGDLFKVN